MPAREVFVSETMRHQLVAVTALLGATGRQFGWDTDTIPAGEDVLHNDVPWYLILAEGRFNYIHPLINDLEAPYDLRADREGSDNLAIKPVYRERLVHMRELVIAESHEDDAGFGGGTPAVREVR